MAVLTEQFDDALTAIEPDADATNAKKAHEQVRDALKADPSFSQWGLESILIGSYMRHVSIKRVKDVDVFCKLLKLPSSYNPVELLQHTQRVLDKAFPPRNGQPRTEIQGRSVKVEFPEYDELHVDAVPARPADAVWEIPCKNPGDGWDQTNPEHFSILSSLRNDEFGTIYVPVVKLVRQTRRALLGLAKPGGLFVEVAAYHAFDAHPRPGGAGAYTSTAAYYANTLRVMADAIRNHANGTQPLENPAMPGQELRVRATDEEWANITTKWEEASSKAMAALASQQDCPAAKTFRELLGQDSLGSWVFPLPSGCNPDGTNRAVVVMPGADRLPSKESPTFG
ncbi:MAG: nucleotidyltransferase [Actinomycetota bacterium]